MAFVHASVGIAPIAASSVAFAVRIVGDQLRGAAIRRRFDLGGAARDATRILVDDVAARGTE